MASSLLRNVTCSQGCLKKLANSRLHIHYSHSVCTLLKLKRLVLLLFESIIALPFARCERERSEICWPLAHPHSIFTLWSTTLHMVTSVTRLQIPPGCRPSCFSACNIENLGVAWRMRLVQGSNQYRENWYHTMAELHMQSKVVTSFHCIYSYRIHC